MIRKEKSNKFQIDNLRNQGYNSRLSFNFIQEKNQLTNFCQGILNSIQVQENDNEVSQINLNLEFLQEIVNHLIEIEPKTLQFDIDIMIDLKMHEFITKYTFNIVKEHFKTNNEILVNLLRLVLIWSNGTSQQCSFLFDLSFITFIFYFSQQYYFQNSFITCYSLETLKNLLKNKYLYDRQDISLQEIIIQLHLLFDKNFSEIESDTSIINAPFINSTGYIFLCFQEIIKNYIQKENSQNFEYEINGIIVITKKWIKFIQKYFFTTISPFENETFSFSNDYIDYNFICDSVCVAISCMNDIIKVNNELSAFFFTKNFIYNNLIYYLKSSNPNLKKNGLRTLKRALTVVGRNNFSAWNLMDARVWITVRDALKYENNTEIRFYYVKVISKILFKLPSIIQTQSCPYNPNNQEINQNQDINENQDIYENQDIDEDQDINGNQENPVNFENECQDCNIEEEEEEDRSETDTIDSSSFYRFIIEFFDAGILSEILNLSDQKEPIKVRIAAALGIAKVISTFGLTEKGYFVKAGVIPVFIQSLDIVDDKDIEFIFNAILVIFEYIERLDDKAIALYLDDFEKCDAENVFKEMLDNPVYEGKIDNHIGQCIDKLNNLRGMLNESQKKYNEKRRERNKMIKEMQLSSEDDKDFLREYEEEDN